MYTPTHLQVTGRISGHKVRWNVGKVNFLEIPFWWLINLFGCQWPADWLYWTLELIVSRWKTRTKCEQNDHGVQSRPKWNQIARDWLIGFLEWKFIFHCIVDLTRKSLKLFHNVASYEALITGTTRARKKRLLTVVKKWERKWNSFFTFNWKIKSRQIKLAQKIEQRADLSVEQLLVNPIRMVRGLSWRGPLEC